MAEQVYTGRYQIVRHLAKGGMSEVYLARDLLLDRPVALKVLVPEIASDRLSVERFRREARAVASLSHPDIVSIYDWGEEDGMYFIVMEYIDGLTLREVIERQRPIRTDRAAEICADIARALHFAHIHGVIHRDIKPGNVMITQSQVKVTDFGVARFGNPLETLTVTGAVMGTPTYFSPEQALGKVVDPRTDIYSLGAVLYEMVTGVPPFTGEHSLAIAYQHVNDLPVPPRERNSKVSRGFQRIILKALSKDREARYDNAAQMQAELLIYSHP